MWGKPLRELTFLHIRLKIYPESCSFTNTYVVTLKCLTITFILKSDLYIDVAISENGYLLSDTYPSH